MIYFNQVTKLYETNNTVALKDVNLKIQDGEFVFVIGSSGAGKSTLIKLITAEEKQTQGEVIVNDIDISRLAKNEIPYYRRSLGIVFQDFRLLSTKNVFNNVAFALRVRGASQSEIKRVVPNALNMVGIADKASAMPHELSGGEQQRVALARAMVNHPQLLIADEPTGNLDPERSMEIISILKEINSMGTTVVVVTHDFTIVNEMKERIIELSDGRIVRDERRGVYREAY